MLCAEIFRTNNRDTILNLRRLWEVFGERREEVFPLRVAVAFRKESLRRHVAQHVLCYSVQQGARHDRIQH